ncbi:AraC family transcriptional regulator [Dysgonomonas sp. 511]|uniref:helix-turn-helix domain-containing protein n=1 Tax=Dysgonomonas sp. 511 TaxID=2302930 RepID=UPI0013CFED25|nr:helix-turn-helix domain-containing protein [Dysgonomonas sp. 511]NDV77418.1 helix-turn-helix domain-containing protein [Dysgonomonas sp. 511]
MKEKIYLNQLSDKPFVEVFKLEEIEDGVFFDNYQRYDFYQLIWFTEAEGDTCYSIDFNDYVIEEDTAFLVFPGQIDKLDVNGKKGFLYAMHNDVFFRISQHIAAELNKDSFLNTRIALDGETKKVLVEINSLIFEEYNSQNRLALIQSYMEAFFFHIAALFDKDEVFKEKRDSTIDQLMILIDKNFVAYRETDFYAEQVGMTNKTVNELCKRSTGKTVKQHVQERLILEIKKEIRLGRKSLKEIAFDLGFNEPAYFTRFFKQQTSFTPSQFRDS